MIFVVVCAPVALIAALASFAVISRRKHQRGKVLEELAHERKKSLAQQSLAHAPHGDLSGPCQGYAPTEEDGGEHHYENVAKAGEGDEADDGAYTMMAAVSTTAC